MLALVDGRPRYLSLPKMIQLFLNHRREVVVRRTRYDLDRAEKRLHIVQGLLHGAGQHRRGREDHPQRLHARRGQGSADGNLQGAAGDGAHVEPDARAASR